MAADETWSTDKRRGGLRPGAPAPAGAHDPERPPRDLDAAIARLSTQLRGSGPAGQPDKKFRFDFRTHRPASPESETEPAGEEADASATASALDAAFAGLQSAIDQRWAADASPPAPPEASAPLETVDTQLEAIRQRLAELAGGAARRGELADASQPRERPHRPPSAAAQSTESMESRRAFSMSVLENHLARLAGEVAMLGQRRAPADPELLSRLAELQDLVAANHPGAEIERLEHQIAAVGRRIEALFAAIPQPENFADIARRVDAASKRLDELAASQSRPLHALDTLTREIAILRREVATVLRRPDAGIEAQIAALAGRVDAIGENAGGPALQKLEAQIAAMAERLDDSITAPAPPRAAERRSEASPPAPSRAEGLLIMALKEDLLRLQAGHAAGASQGAARQPRPEAPRRPDRPPPDEAARRAPSLPQPSRREIEPAADDHRPLEPGSGRPGQRAAPGGRKAEFVAAARRAAVAAAAETETLPPASRRRAPFNAGGVGDVLRGRRGAALLAAGIVAIALAAAVPIFLLTSDRNGAMLAGGDTALSPTEEAIVALEDLPVAKTAARLTEPQPTSAPAVQPVPAIDLDPTAPTENRFTVLDPAMPIGPGLKDSSRLPPVSPDLTAGTPPAPLFPEVPSLQPAPLPPEAAGPERLRNAAAAGDPAALFEVAARYAEGRGVPVNAAEAANWYRLAAERGLAMAQFRIASLYERGEGVTQNRATAADWYRRAAEQGNVRAMHNLAVMLSEGVGGAPDFGGAAGWFTRAADHGVRDSQYNLGVMFARGLGGPQDLVQSYKWFAIAAHQGDPDAGTRRDEVAKVLSPDQLAQAQATVRAWRASEPAAKANVPPVADDSWQGQAGPVSALDRQALVRLIQERLTERGFDPGPADGHPGPMTRDAVIAFQRERGVPATGEIGPELLAALDLPKR